MFLIHVIMMIMLESKYEKSTTKLSYDFSVVLLLKFQKFERCLFTIPSLYYNLFELILLADKAVEQPVFCVFSNNKFWWKR